MALKDDADERARTVLRVAIRSYFAQHPNATEDEATKWMADTIFSTRKGREPRVAAEVLMAIHLDREIRALVRPELRARPTHN